MSCTIPQKSALIRMGNALETPRQQQQKHDDHGEEHQQQPLPSQNQNPYQKENFTCQICFEPRQSQSEKFKNQGLCTHPFCTDCIVKYITAKLEHQEGNAARIPCPASHCTHSLDPISCRPILSPPLFVEWCDKLRDATLLDLDTCHCPYHDCSTLVINECGGDVSRVECPNCKGLFCFKCKSPWHAGFTCQESKGVRDPNDVAFGLLAEEKNWMRCPRCRHFIERTQGCKIIACRCGTSFCYNCGRYAPKCQCNHEGCGLVCLCLVIFIIFIIFLYFDGVSPL